MTDTHQDLARQAELEINAILARLEAATGRLVTDLSLRNTNITRLDTTGKELLSGSVIELQQNPDHRIWESKP